MNKTVIIILGVLLLVSLVFNLITPIKMLLISNFGHNIMFANTVINDEKAALAYGKLIINIVYGESEQYNESEQHEPYRVTYDKLYRVWRVAGSLPEDAVGGIPIVVFDRNGRIMRVTHSR